MTKQQIEEFIQSPEFKTERLRFLEFYRNTKFDGAQPVRDRQDMMDFMYDPNYETWQALVFDERSGYRMDFERSAGSVLISDGRYGIPFNENMLKDLRKMYENQKQFHAREIERLTFYVNKIEDILEKF